MSDSVTQLANRLVADYLNGGHRTWFVSDLNAIANVEALMVALAAQAAASAATANAALAVMQGLGASAYGIGLDPLDLPRAGDLGSNAVRDWESTSGIFTSIQNTSYQITMHDHGKLLLSTSGANTWTLPLSTDVPDGFWFLYHNISGSNLVIQRTSTDTINGAVTTSVTISTGAAIGQVNKRDQATIYHIG